LVSRCSLTANGVDTHTSMNDPGPLVASTCRRTHCLASSYGAIGAQTALTLADCVPLIEARASAAKAVRADVIVLCHGGPIATPEDAAYILEHCPSCHGFYGASSMERLPVETALTETTRRFTQISGDRT